MTPGTGRCVDSREDVLALMHLADSRRREVCDVRTAALIRFVRSCCGAAVRVGGTWPSGLGWCLRKASVQPLADLVWGVGTATSLLARDQDSGRGDSDDPGQAH